MSERNFELDRNLVVKFLFVVFVLLLLYYDCRHYIMLRNEAKKFHVYYRTRSSVVVFKRPTQMKPGHILCSESCFAKKKIAVLLTNCNLELKPV